MRYRFHLSRNRSMVVLIGCLFAANVAAAPPELPQDVSDYVHIHSLAITDADNPLFGFHHFYANPEALAALAAGGPYPERSIFLGAVYDVETDGAQINEGTGAGYTLMVKDPQAKETGGWRFAQYRPDGGYIEQNEVTACFECHTQVRDRHFVFSQPLEPLLLPQP